MRRFLVALLACAWAVHAADPAYSSARRKLDLIEEHRAPRGSVIVFSQAEINAWARVEVPAVVPEGIRDERVELGNGSATGYALVDLLTMRQARGRDTNWFVARLIEGERPLRVMVDLQSGHGRCTVFLRRVEISGVAASGAALDFLIRTFFLPLYPDAKIGQPFELGYNIDRIDVRADGVRVTVKP